MRNLSNVIDQLLKHIPENEPVVQRLKAVQASISYTAPEVIGYRWKECASILCAELGQSDSEWKKQVEKIFIGGNRDNV